MAVLSDGDFVLTTDERAIVIDSGCLISEV